MSPVAKKPRSALKSFMLNVTINKKNKKKQKKKIKFWFLSKQYKSQIIWITNSDLIK